MSSSLAIDSFASPPSITNTGPHLDTTTVSTPSWLLWQFLDSALPTGGFIASNGLEAFAKLHPDQTSSRDIEAYINWSVHSCGYTNLPFITAVWKLVDDWTLKDSQLKTEKGRAKAMSSVLHRISNLDREYDIFMNNAIQNAASRKQGDGIIMMGVKCFAEQLNDKNSSKNTNGRHNIYGDQEEEENENDNELGPNIRILKPFKAMLRSEDVAGHYPIAFAMIARLLGFDLGKKVPDENIALNQVVYTFFFNISLSLNNLAFSYYKISPFAFTCPNTAFICYPSCTRRTIPSTTYHDPFSSKGTIYRCQDS